MYYFTKKHSKVIGGDNNDMCWAELVPGDVTHVSGDLAEFGCC